MQDRFKFRVYKKAEKKMINGVTYLNPFLLDERVAPEEAKNNIAMQCTGLKDKNGTLIYEGDIVQILGDEIPYIINFEEDRAMFVIESKIDRVCCNFDNYFSNELEVIGNIYENSELLEGREE